MLIYFFISINSHGHKWNEMSVTETLTHTHAQPCIVWYSRSGLWFDLRCAFNRKSVYNEQKPNFVLFKIHDVGRLILEKKKAPSLLNRFSIHGTDINLLLLALNFKYKEILRRKESLEWVMGSLLSLSSKLRMNSSIVLYE